MLNTFCPTLFLDLPHEGIINTPMEQLWGWIHVSDSTGVMDIKLDGHSLNCSRIYRSNLNYNQHLGFSLFLDLPRINTRKKVQAGIMNLEVFLDQKLITNIPLNITDYAIKNLDYIIESNHRKRRFILENVKEKLHQINDCRAPSALPINWEIHPSISCKKDAVSSHMYGKVVQDFLSTIPKNGFVLDAGAGFRKIPYDNVINMEIYDYPSTDILAIGQSLPFKDNCFDGALSLAVLEHVDDPFLCAKELIRVVKPGGRILVIVPFLQAEHGYPSHFFNCTRFGLRKLFSSARLIDHFLEISNSPIFTIYQILSIYANGLPETHRHQFMEMKIADILSKPPIEWAMGNHEIVTGLDEETQWMIASGTTAVFEKNPD